MTRQTHKPQSSENKQKKKKINILDFPPVKILVLNNTCHLLAQ